MVCLALELVGPWGVLSVFWQFVGFSLLWHFLTVCGFVQVACQGFFPDYSLKELMLKLKLQYFGYLM